jgi:hypothetical protein
MGGMRQSRERRPREHKVTVRLSEAEMAAMTAAAERAGLTLAAYIIRAGMDAAEHRDIPITEIPQVDREKPGSLAGFQRRTPLARKRPSSLVRSNSSGTERRASNLNGNHHRSPPRTDFCWSLGRAQWLQALLTIFNCGGY